MKSFLGVLPGARGVWLEGSKDGTGVKDEVEGLGRVAVVKFLGEGEGFVLLEGNDGKQGIAGARQIESGLSRFSSSAVGSGRCLACRQQLISMALAQLTWREGLRDIADCLNARPHARYHLGFREPIAKSTLADANEQM